jgi:hypothetical protein
MVYDNVDSDRAASNRENAKQSTGPRTEEGKRASSANALKWGLWSAKALIPGEREEEFDAFRAGLREATKPDGALEEVLVERVIVCGWRLLRRLPRAEAELVAKEMGSTTALGHAYLADCQGVGAVGRLARDEGRLERGFYKALHELQRLQAARAGRNVPLPVVADVNLDVAVGQGGMIDDSSEA